MSQFAPFVDDILDVSEMFGQFCSRCKSPQRRKVAVAPVKSLSAVKVSKQLPVRATGIAMEQNASVAVT